MRLHVLWCFLLFSRCHGVIYHLNDTEYALMPRLFEMDHYDTCMSDVAGLYCVVKLNLYAGRASPMMRMIQEYSAFTSKHYNYSYIERGICVTKTCKQFVEQKILNNEMDLNATLEACLNNSISKEYNIEAKLSHVYYCIKPNEQKNFDISDWTVAALLLALLFLTIIGTFYDIAYFDIDVTDSDFKVNRVLLNFSLRKNWRKLVKLETGDPRHNILKGFHGIRSITTCQVLIAHVIIINSMGFTEEPHEFEKTYDTIHFYLIYNGLVIVQIYFVMSAFLQVFHTLIKSETTPVTLSQLPKLLLFRWCSSLTGTGWVSLSRLTPAYAVMIAFTATWMRHVGSGPLWRLYVSDSVVAQCRRFWWHHLTYINNYVPEDKYCALQTWHLAADTQLFVVSMVIYLATKPSRRILALSLMMIVAMAAPALHVYLQDFNPLVLQTPEFYRCWAEKSFHHLHILGHNNLSGYVIGLITGTLVYNWQKNKMDFSKYKKWGNLSWLIIPAIGCLFLSGRGFYAEGELAPLAVRVLYAGTLRAAMGLLVAGGVISLTMRLSDSFCKFFEWDGWLVPSKLSYSIFLLHMNLTHILLGLRTQLGLVSSFNLLVAYFGVLTMSVLMAVPFNLMVEAPINGLLISFVKPERTNSSVEKNVKKK